MPTARSKVIKYTTSQDRTNTKQASDAKSSDLAPEDVLYSKDTVCAIIAPGEGQHFYIARVIFILDSEVVTILA